MNKFIITGELFKKGDTVNVSEKFKKREFVIRQANSGNAGEYFTFVKFELRGDKTELIDKFDVLDNIRVDFNLIGKEWQNKIGEYVYFNCLVVSDIQKHFDRADGLNF